jgi:hypothetical protein
MKRIKDSVVNLSNTPLDQPTIQMLSKGLKFMPTPYNQLIGRLYTSPIRTFDEKRTYDISSNNLLTMILPPIRSNSRVTLHLRFLTMRTS